MKLPSLIKLRAGADPNKPLTDQRIHFMGFSITIEYPQGSVRELRNDEGEIVYKKLMLHSYGFFNHTQGRDRDEVDVILGPDEKAKEVYIAHMIDKGPDVEQREDEDKVLLGFKSYEAAKGAFLQMYPANFFGGMTVLSIAIFRKKLAEAQLPHREKKIHATFAF